MKQYILICFLLLFAAQVSAQSVALGPRVVAAGPMLDGNPPVYSSSLPVPDPGSAKRIVDSLKQVGVDFIKVYNRLSRDIFFAIADACKQQNLSLAGHSLLMLHIE